MFTKHSETGLLIGFLVVALGSAAASAQQSEVAAGINSPPYSLTDPNGINLASNKPSGRVEGVGIGPADRPLTVGISTFYTSGSFASIGFADTYNGRVFASADSNQSAECQAISANSYMDVMLGSSTDRMCGTGGGSYIPQRGTGSFMVATLNGPATYTKSDGTQYQFGIGPNSSFWLLSRITSPEGLITTLTYKSATVSGSTVYRLQSVNRNDGFQLKYSYESNVAPASLSDSWFNLASVRAINNAIEYCDPTADSCTFASTWPQATLTRSSNGSLRYLTVTDAGGRATRFTIGIPVLSGGVYGSSGVTQFVTDQLLATRLPTSTSADTFVYTYCAPAGEYLCMKSGVRSVSTDAGVWTYNGTSGSGGVSVFIQLTSTRPGGGSRQTTQQAGNYWQGPLISYSDNLTLRTYQFESSVANRVSDVLLGDGDKLTYSYDTRGNITQETHTAKSGSPLAPTIRSANYDATCTNPVKCNKPNWVKDANGNQIDFEYDPVHGGLLKITGPPPVPGDVRPQIRQTYTQRYAWYKNSSGAVVQAPSPVWVLIAKAHCRKTAALVPGPGCTDPADEVTTTYEYGPNSGANNLFVKGMTVTADGVTLRTCYGYDIYGNRISETLPKAGLTTCP